MKDRFKFRVFDKNSNNYIKEKMFYINEFGELFKYEKSKSTVYINAPSPYVMCFCRDNYILEQCTGLKDKNGKLIYEHDLIKFDDDERIFEVFWDNASYCYRLGDIETKYVCTLAFVNHYNIEIIGNIHENPELLKENKDEK